MKPVRSGEDTSWSSAGLGQREAINAWRDWAASTIAVDLMMPQGWLEKYLPDPQALLARPYSAREGWGAPSGAMLETILEGGRDHALLPRPLIAEHVGSLLALARAMAALPR